MDRVQNQIKMDRVQNLFIISDTGQGIEPVSYSQKTEYILNVSVTRTVYIISEMMFHKTVRPLESAAHPLMFVLSDFRSISLGEQSNHHGDQNVKHSLFRSECSLENDVGRR